MIARTILAAFAALMISLALSSGFALAHSGDTDSYGCHTNYQTGGYHCH